MLSNEFNNVSNSDNYKNQALKNSYDTSKIKKFKFHDAYLKNFTNSSLYAREEFTHIPWNSKVNSFLKKETSKDETHYFKIVKSFYFIEITDLVNKINFIPHTYNPMQIHNTLYRFLEDRCFCLMTKEKIEEALWASVSDIFSFVFDSLLGFINNGFIPDEFILMDN